MQGSTRVRGCASHAVDVGCGSGQNTHHFSQHFSRVTGVDVSEQQLEQAINAYKHIENLHFQ